MGGVGRTARMRPRKGVAAKTAAVVTAAPAAAGAAPAAAGAGATAAWRCRCLQLQQVQQHRRQPPETHPPRLAAALVRGEVVDGHIHYPHLLQQYTSTANMLPVMDTHASAGGKATHAFCCHCRRSRAVHTAQALQPRRLASERPACALCRPMLRKPHPAEAPPNQGAQTHRRHRRHRLAGH